MVDRASTARRRAGSLLVVLVALALWWAAAQVQLGGRAVLADPFQTLRALPGAAALLGADLLATFGRAALGLALGVAVAAVGGTVAVLALPHAPAVEPLLDVARSVPPVVLLPVFLLALGFNDAARIATVAAGCVWVLILAATTAARAPRSGRAEVLILAGASRLQRLRWTQPWESAGVLLLGLRTAASTAVVVAVVTEMVAGAEHGIGARVVMAQLAGDATGLTLALVAIGLAGYAINAALRRLEAWGKALAG